MRTNKTVKKTAKKVAAKKPVKTPAKKTVKKTSRKLVRKTGRRGPRSAAQRVTGLLVMLPWIMQRKRVKISTMAKQFNLTESELI